MLIRTAQPYYMEIYHCKGGYAPQTDRFRVLRLAELRSSIGENTNARDLGRSPVQKQYVQWCSVQLVMQKLHNVLQGALPTPNVQFPHSNDRE